MENVGVIICPSCHRMLTIEAKMTEKRNKTPLLAEHDIGELLDKIDVEALSPWEKSFVEDHRKRYKQFGAKTRMSEKQMDTLRKIAEGERF